MSNQSSLQAACLAAGLASAWAPTAEAGTVAGTEVRYDVHITMDITHALLFFGNASAPGTPQTGVMLTDLTLPGSGSGSSFFGRSLAEFGSSFAMIGLGSGSSGWELLVSFGSLTYINGLAFSDAFPGYNEPAIIDSLLTGTPLAQVFLRDQFGNTRQDNATYSRVVAFSGEQDVGTISFAVIPAPSAAAAVGAPLMLLARRRRR